MHISDRDLEIAMHQRVLVRTLRVKPELTIDQIYQCYLDLMREEAYSNRYQEKPMCRTSLANRLLEWSKGDNPWLIWGRRGKCTHYRFIEVIDEPTGCIVSNLYHAAMKRCGFERNQMQRLLN